MNKYSNDMILCRIVANLLFKKIGGIGITMANSPLYDMIVEEKGIGLFFGVKVGDMNYQNSQQYASYLAVLNQSNYFDEDERLPIILMCVDKESEAIKFGFQLTWQRYMATVQNKVKLVDITPNNWTNLIENLKEMDRVIRALNSDKVSIVKRITIKRKMLSDRVDTADIIYLRKFTENYKLKQKEVTTTQDSFERMVYGIPENEYPNDLLDDVIFKGIEQVFPHPIKKSQSLLFNTELQDLKRELEKTQKKFNIMVEPNFNDLNNNYIFNKSFHFLQIPLILYHNPIKIFNDNFTDEYTSVFQPFEEWVKNYGILEKLTKETLRNITDVITKLD